jgi:uncharacterized membrane protein (DUF4010 family)
VLGARRGYAVAGLLGGVVSSTQVTFTFAGASRTQAGLGTSLATGVLAASTTMFIRVAVAVAVLNAALLPPLVPYLIAPFIVGGIASVAGLRSQRDAISELPMAENPLQIAAALRMTALFQIVLFVVYAADRVWGSAGVLATGAVVGLTDVDALMISMAQSSRLGLDPTIAARAIAIGIVSNSLLKTLLAAAIGRGQFRWLAAAGLAAMAAAGAAALVL